VLVLAPEQVEDPPKVEAKTRVQLPDGREGWLHPSGSITNEAGRWITRPPQSAPRITAHSAYELHQKRRDVASAAVRRAIIERTGAQGLPGGIQRLAQVQVDIALDQTAGYNSTRAFRELLAAGGLLGPEAVEGRPGISGEATEAINAVLPVMYRLLQERAGGGEG